LEIWLDVVFNHTAEFGADGPEDHFKLLAPDHWYLLEEDGTFTNFSGCGNTLNCAHPTTRRMIRDCLIYWSQEMGVENFWFHRIRKERQPQLCHFTRWYDVDGPCFIQRKT